MTKYNLGDRVAVNITRPDEWAMGAAACLNRKLGVITAITNRDGKDVHLVEFDFPAPTWWTNQTPPTAHWFATSELEAVS